MRILIINPPYQTLTSNLGVGHQTPLGLLMVGGSLLDAGHSVRLLDAEAAHLGDGAIADIAYQFKPDLVMTGHAGSTPAHPVCMRMLAAIKAQCPRCVTVYGGVYPSYQAAAVLREGVEIMGNRQALPGDAAANAAAVDIVVRGEGEVTAVALADALDAAAPLPPQQAIDADALEHVEGITFLKRGCVVHNAERPPIADLDQRRVGWELIDDWDRYQCFGMGRAVVAQFSRGCPHRCTYCGQHGFWVRWRHRSIDSFVDELARLRDEHDVRFVTLADENPTTDPRLWRQLLEAIIERDLGMHFFSTMRATDIVRDRDWLHLYRKAGILYVLMGIESTDDRVLQAVNKKSTSLIDYQACQLLKDAGIFAMIGHIVGLGDETWADFRRASRVLSRYDGDLLNAMFVTPHAWTQFATEQGSRGVVQTDQGRWDYRHQVLEQSKLSPWQLLLAVKWLEFVFHMRPTRWRRIWQMDGFQKRQVAWSMWHMGQVWLGEIVEAFAASRHHAKQPRPLRAHCDLQDHRTPLRLTVSATHRQRQRASA